MGVLLRLAPWHWPPDCRHRRHGQPLWVLPEHKGRNVRHHHCGIGHLLAGHLRLQDRGPAGPHRGQQHRQRNGEQLCQRLPWPGHAVDGWGHLLGSDRQNRRLVGEGRGGRLATVHLQQLPQWRLRGPFRWACHERRCLFLLRRDLRRDPDAPPKVLRRRTRRQQEGLLRDIGIPLLALVFVHHLVGGPVWRGGRVRVSPRAQSMPKDGCP
mmetsp:Transcript_71391/g.197133  ORF Transcript_71391/g.197133 Transcript_71391/m.197133 type:complete len:211 (-) Transcript_71391:95-727(-)